MPFLCLLSSLLSLPLSVEATPKEITSETESKIQSLFLKEPLLANLDKELNRVYGLLLKALEPQKR